MQTVEAQPVPPGPRRRSPFRLSPARLILLGILGVYFVGLLALGGHHAWGRLGVPPSQYSFYDLRSLTSGWECTRRGIDVLPANPCDPGLRPANYPRLWLDLSPLGLGQGSTVPLGFVIAAAFLVAAFALLPAQASAFEAVAFGAAVCSPAVMLGVERGNVDLLLFALVVLAVLLLRRSERPFASHALILLAALLKLFPIFAAGVLLRQRPRAARIGFAAVLLAFGVYALVTLDDIRTIERVTPQSSTYSWGIRFVSEWLTSGIYSLARHVGAGSIERLGLRVWDLGLAALVVGAALLARQRLRAQAPQDLEAGAVRDLDLFVAGAGVYVCSYALFRSFDYRLVFVLLTVPQLLRWGRERRALALVALAALYATLWLDADLDARVPGLGRALRGWDRLSTVAPFHLQLPLAVIAQLTLFAALVCCLAATASGGGGRSRSSAS